MLEYLWLLKTIYVVASVLDIYVLFAIFGCFYLTGQVGIQNGILRERNAVLDSENKYLKLALGEITSISRGKDGIVLKFKPKLTDEVIN